MYHSITFGVKNTWDDWHLIPKSRPEVNPPAVKTNYIEIPGGDGVLDLTTALAGRPLFKNRTGTFDFYVDSEFKNWMVLYSEILAYLQGQKLRMVLEDDPTYYYEGRFTVNNPAADPNYTMISITYDVGPYKKDIDNTLSEWLWDEFNFEIGIIRYYKNLEINGSTLVRVVGAMMPTTVVIYASNSLMTVEFQGTTYALAKGANVIEDIVIVDGENHLTSCVTVREFVNDVYMPTFTENLAPTTRENYRQYITLNIVPFLGEIPMDKVTVATVQRFYDWMASASKRGRKQNLNKKTIERVSGLTSRIFKVAVEMKVIAESPFKKTLLTIRAEEAGHHEALPDAVVRRLKQDIPLLENRDERVYMALLIYTGMRPEEVRGIAWEDLDLDGQYGRITRAVTYPNNNQAYIGKPKTNRSGRTVLLAKPLVEILRPEQQSFGFVGGGEQPWCYSKAARVSARAFRHLGIEGYTDYDFRATFGTQLKEIGMTSALVADVMGHADTRMVETVYARARHEGIMKRLADVERLNM